MGKNLTFWRKTHNLTISISTCSVLILCCQGLFDMLQRHFDQNRFCYLLTLHVWQSNDIRLVRPQIGSFTRRQNFRLHISLARKAYTSKKFLKELYFLIVALIERNDMKGMISIIDRIITKARGNRQFGSSIQSTTFSKPRYRSSS